GGGGGGDGNMNTGPDMSKVADPNDPNNDKKDTDCDGLNDAEEFALTYPDSDGDGIKDGVEAGRTMSVDPMCNGFVGDADPMSRTLPTEPDSDVDGIPDGVEDAGHDGRLDGNDTDPNNPDSDG